MNHLLNSDSFELCKTTIANAAAWRVEERRLANGALLLDFGVKAVGGVHAGLMLARICMSGRAEISIHPSDSSRGPWPIVQVATDEPVQACMASQYAGWPVKNCPGFSFRGYIYLK